MSPRIALIGCGKAKASTTCVASEMYRSQLFRAALRYAVLTCDRHYILSAKHGLLEPHALIEPYEQRLPRGAARAEWGRRVGAQLDVAVPELDAEIIVLAGREYADAIDPPRLFYWDEPLAGLVIGQRLAWLKEHARLGAA